AGADWIGINLHSGSPRFVPPPRANEIVRALGCPERVGGVFVNTPANEVADLADQIGLQSVQLHGEESPEDLVALGRFHIIWTFRLGGTHDIGAMNVYLQRAANLGRSPDAVLVEARVEGA